MIARTPCRRRWTAAVVAMGLEQRFEVVRRLGEHCISARRGRGILYQKERRRKKGKLLAGGSKRRGWDATLLQVERGPRKKQRGGVEFGPCSCAGEESKERATAGGGGGQGSGVGLCVDGREGADGGLRPIASNGGPRRRPAGPARGVAAGRCRGGRRKGGGVQERGRGSPRSRRRGSGVVALAAVADSPAAAAVAGGAMWVGSHAMRRKWGSTSLQWNTMANFFIL